MLLVVLLLLAIGYYFGLQRHKPSSVWMQFQRKLLWLARKPFEFLLWLRSPVMRMQLRTTKIELHKSSALEAAVAGRRIRKAPPPGVPQDGLLPMQERGGKRADAVPTSS